MSDPYVIIGIQRKGGSMRTIDELVNEIYEDNFSHIDFMEIMGGDCDCNIHTTLELITKYWWDEEK